MAETSSQTWARGADSRWCLAHAYRRAFPTAGTGAALAGVNYLQERNSDWSNVAFDSVIHQRRDKVLAKTE